MTLPREFFTNLWVRVLSDAEIATYLTLRFVRARRRREHEEFAVFVTSGGPETFFRLRRSTWRSADMLYHLRLVAKIPAIKPRVHPDGGEQRSAVLRAAGPT
jgi:hypothetical protein